MTKKEFIVVSDRWPAEEEVSSSSTFRICAISFDDKYPSLEAVKSYVEELHSVKRAGYNIPREIKMMDGVWEEVAIPSRVDGISVHGEITNRCILSYLYSFLRESDHSYVIVSGEHGDVEEVRETIIVNFNLMRAVRIHKKWNKISMAYFQDQENMLKALIEITSTFNFVDKNGCIMDCLQSLSIHAATDDVNKMENIKRMSASSLRDWNWDVEPETSVWLKKWKTKSRAKSIIC